MACELVWGPPGGADPAKIERATVASVDELEALLDRLDAIGRAAEPFIVELIDPEAGRLTIGVGRDWSVATFERADGEPPYLISAGEPRAEPLVFYYGGEWTELPPEAAIPADRAREALRAFFRDGKLSDAVEWTET